MYCVNRAVTYDTMCREPVLVFRCRPQVCFFNYWTDQGFEFSILEDVLFSILKIGFDFYILTSIFSPLLQEMD